MVKFVSIFFRTILLLSLVCGMVSGVGWIWSDDDMWIKLMFSCLIFLIFSAITIAFIHAND